MGVNSDKIVGAGLLFFSVGVFAYYTLWVIILPFVDVNHPVQQYFPPKHYAIQIPLVLLIIIFVLVVTFIGTVMIKSSKPFAKTKSKAA
mmetsp:Transcript_16223/g.23808  ORF Transcript_16223/g.23808 Transcript_16223/m.23808 type:complete len:89 (-) Transcript_16223:44-310(-)